MTELQLKAIEVLKEYGYTESEDGGFHLLRNGIPIQIKWVPEKDGFLRFDRIEGQWILTSLRGIGNGEYEWIYPAEDIILLYSNKVRVTVF